MSRNPWAEKNMASRSSGAKKRSSSATKNTKRKSPLILFAIFGGACLILMAFWLFGSKKPDTLPSESDKESRLAVKNESPEARTRDLNKLVGRWIRTDGGYVIDIRKIHADGEMEAGYYNPRPINVSRAEATWTQSGPEIFVELQDQGYPGSTYTLTLDASKKNLAGFYYQAAMKQEFDVVFVRME